MILKLFEKSYAIILFGVFLHRLWRKAISVSISQRWRSACRRMLAAHYHPHRDRNNNTVKNRKWKIAWTFTLKILRRGCVVRVRTSKNVEHMYTVRKVLALLSDVVEEARITEHIYGEVKHEGSNIIMTGLGDLDRIRSFCRLILLFFWGCNLAKSICLNAVPLTPDDVETEIVAASGLRHGSKRRSLHFLPFFRKKKLSGCFKI